MSARTTPRRASIVPLSAFAAALAAAFGVASGAAGAPGEPQARLAGRTFLPAATSRPGSPPSGAFLSPDERATAAANGVRGPAQGPYLPGQPVQGFSSMVPAEGGTWWVLADNGYAWRPNSADFQLAIYRVDPRWGDPAGPAVLATVVLHDPERHLSWTIVCDPAWGTPLPPFAFNALPAPPRACGDSAAERRLTGFDLDPESFVRAPDGTFWIGEEFGPFLVHVAADGRVLEPPVPFPGVRTPQNPFLSIADRTRAERPNLAGSRGPEGVALSPDGATLYALLEGAVAGDDPRDLRIYVFDVRRRAFRDEVLRLTLELPSQQVNLAALNDRSGARVYPDAAAPPRGPVSIGELKAVNDRQLLVIERDNEGDGPAAPRHKKVYLLDLPRARGGGGRVTKTPLLDLLAIPDPDGLGGDGDFFRLPYYTIESVHVVDARTLLVASDNNFPFSNGRARGRAADRSGPLAPDPTEIVLVRLGTPLDVDPRLLPSRGGM